jgi:hypothetical protein
MRLAPGGACYLGSNLRCTARMCIPCTPPSAGPCAIGGAICLTGAPGGGCYTGSTKKCAAVDAWIIARGLGGVGAPGAGLAFLVASAADAAGAPPSDVASPQRWYYAKAGGDWEADKAGARVTAHSPASTTAVTTAVTTGTVAAPTTTGSQCEQFTCVLQCEDSCGWDRLLGECKAGLQTSDSERDERLGDCKEAQGSADGTAATAAGAALGVVAITVLAVALARRQSRRALSARYAAVANRQARAPAVPDTPRPQGSAYAGVPDPNATYAEILSDVGEPQASTVFTGSRITDYSGDAYTEQAGSGGGYEEAQTLTSEYAATLRVREAAAAEVTGRSAGRLDPATSQAAADNQYEVDSEGDDFDV